MTQCKEIKDKYSGKTLENDEEINRDIISKAETTVRKPVDLLGVRISHFSNVVEPFFKDPKNLHDKDRVASDNRKQMASVTRKGTFGHYK